MADVVKWLTLLAVNQACVGSSPIVRPIDYQRDENRVFYLFICSFIA